MTYEVGSRYPIPGDKVKIVEKKNYDYGTLTEGIVKNVLTSKKFHPRGHKVRLKNGIIGRVQEFSDTKVEIEEKKPVQYIPDENDLV